MPKMGCCQSHATQREMGANISSWAVAEVVIRQAITNTWHRVEKVLAGEMTTEELQAADLKLVDWLTQTFGGENPHFTAETEWNGRGLALALLETIGDAIVERAGDEPLEDASTVLFFAFAHWVSEVYAVLGEAEVAERGLGNNPILEGFIREWTLMLTGAPSSGDFK